MRTLLIVLGIGAFSLAPSLEAGTDYNFTYGLTSDASHNINGTNPALSGSIVVTGAVGDPVPLVLDDLPPVSVDGVLANGTLLESNLTFSGNLGDPVLTPVSGEWQDTFEFVLPAILTLRTSPDPGLFNSLWTLTAGPPPPSDSSYYDYGFQWSMVLISDNVPEVPEPGSLGLVLAGLAACCLGAIHRRSRQRVVWS